MSGLNKTDIFIALLIAMLCVALTVPTVAVSLVSFPQFGIQFMDEAFIASMIMSAIIPFALSFPVSFALLHQKHKIARLHEELRDTNEQLARSNKKLFRQSSQDHLTGLMNRRYFIKKFGEMRRKADPGSLLYIDVDHFKSINDTYGHDAGDKALKLIANCLQKAMRSDDIVGRLGGEEFAVFATGADASNIATIAEKVRTAIEGIAFNPSDAQPHGLTASIGAAIWQPGEDIEHLLKRADEALYQAKRTGRNKVVLAGELDAAA